MAIGQGGYKGNLDEISRSLESQSGVGDFVDEFRSGPTREFDASAWYGEDETYGTQGAWLTGEGLTDAWGPDPKDRIRSTYSDPITEAVAENPITNLVVDARGMLRRGGGPTAVDWGMLALSALPPVKVAGTAAVNAIKSINQAPFDPTRRTALQRVGTAVAQPGATLAAIVDQTSPFVQEAWQAVKAPFAGLKRARKMKSDLELTKDLDQLKTLYEQIEVPPISQVTHDKIMKMASDQAKKNRLKQASETTSEKVVRLEERRAWKEEIDALEKKARDQNDLRSKVLSMDEGEFDNWLTTASPEDVEVILETQGVDVDKLLARVTKTIRTHDPMVVAEKMAFRPSRVSHEIWAKETADLSLSQTKDLARRLTLRSVD